MTDAYATREIEIRAVTGVTRRLQEAARPGADAIERAKALYWNHRMWSIFIQDLAAPGNRLPEAVRRSYVTLGLYVLRESATAMLGRRDTDILVAINLDLIEALTAQRDSAVLSPELPYIAGGAPPPAHGEIRS